MFSRDPMIIESVEPTEGKEGTILTLRGSGFGKHPRSNCIVIGGMGACARVLEGGSDTEVRARIDPVARASAGDILAWPGVGTEIFTDILDVKGVSLDFAEVAIFQNAADQTRAPVPFRLTEASPDTYGSEQVKSPRHRAELRGLERGSVARATFPKTFLREEFRSVDICLVLKEPTTTLDFTAALARGSSDARGVLDAIASAIVTNFGHIGVTVAAAVAENEETGDYELFVSKPYLERSMLTVHFSAEPARSSAK
jgi:IPT/TIG domain